MLNDQVSLQTVSINGIELSYIEQGAGEPLIFVHGSISDYRTWLLQVEQFSPHYRVISYSRRYHYPNIGGGSGTDYTINLHAADLIAFIEALNLAPANIVGTSFGAYTTLAAAVRRPDLMRKLVICEPPMLPWLLDLPGGQDTWDDFMRNTWFPARQAFQNGELEQGVHLFVDGISGSGAYEHVSEAIRSRMLDNATALMDETLSPDYFTTLSPEQVRRIGLPMLLVRGEQSQKMFHLILDRVAQFLPQARQVTIPNATHSIASSNPQSFYTAVDAFLRNQ